MLWLDAEGNDILVGVRVNHHQHNDRIVRLSACFNEDACLNGAGTERNIQSVMCFSCLCIFIPLNTYFVYAFMLGI